VIAMSRLIQRACVESDRGALSPRDLHLAEALLEAGAEALDLDPTPSARDIVQSASRSMMVGEEGGVAIVSYSEAAAIDRGHLICLGLSDRWPPPLRRTPFARPELLEGAPGLASRDLASEFFGCICAGQRVALMRVGLDRHGRALSPSPFWIAAKQQAPSAPLRRVAALTRPESSRVRLTTSQAPLEASRRTSFSVAEIIQFRRCPRGWLADQTLPREPPTLSQEMGTLSHRALAVAFDPQIPPDAAPAERQRRAERLILERAPGQIDDANARVLIARCARVIERYSPPRWPYRTLHVEEDLEYTGKQGDAIKGRLDRIDLGPRGELLIIDYKQHRLPALRDPSEIADDLQATLYPILARGVLKQRVAGFLFVSIDDATHFGIARPGHQIPEGRGIYDERDDNLGAEAAAASAYRAIEGMRSGVIGPARHSPDETCPCQRL
jgi:RecB family exonuclease